MVTKNALSRRTTTFSVKNMISNRGAPGAPVCYVLIDFRSERVRSRYCQRAERGQEWPYPKFAPRQQKVVVLKAKLLSKNCLPSKVKRSESISGATWRRKGSARARQLPRRASTPPSARPTLLLPPMSCTPEGTTAPVLTTRVQQSSEGQQAADGFLSLDTSPRCHPLPTAPSPGHLFYNSEDHSDMAFIVGHEEWRFPAHSFILRKTPPTLDAILKMAGGQLPDLDVRLATSPGDLGREAPAQGPVVLKLPDLQPDVFEQILRYLYTGQVSLTSVESTLRLLHPCRTYRLSHLTSRCLAYISQHLTASNVLVVLSHLLCPPPDSLQDCEDPQDDHDNERNELVLQCFLVVDRQADLVLRSEAFETLEHALLLEVLKRDSLAVSSEAVVFEAALRWACRACKRQRKELTADNKCQVLGRALFLIRYLVMTPEEFLRGPVSQGVLCREDKELFLSLLSSSGSGTPTPSLPERWNGWKIDVRRQPCQVVSSPPSDIPSDTPVSPSTTLQPLNSSTAKRTDRKKKSMSKKLLNGVGDLVICVIQLLD